MVGPGKGVLKRFRPQTSSSIHGVPHESSSNHVTKGVVTKGVVTKGHKSSSSRHVSLLHKSSNIHELPQPQKSSSSRDVPPLHKSRNNCNDLPPHESSSNWDILMENQGLEEDHQEEDQEIDSIQIETDISDPQLEENIGSASYGMFAILV